jgi:hypothetical protein
MDEALDLFKRVWNRKDLDTEAQIQQITEALSAAYEKGKAEERERCLLIMTEASQGDLDFAIYTVRNQP